MWLLTDDGEAVNLQHAARLFIEGDVVMVVMTTDEPNFVALMKCANEKEACRMIGVIVAALGAGEQWAEAMILRERLAE
jgi:hypothetical protein